MNSTHVPCLNCQKINRVSLNTDPSQQPVCGSCKAVLPLHGGGSELNASTLKKFVEKSPLPVVVDFWAPWCGPCKVFAPTFTKTAYKLARQAAFVKVDIQANPLAGDTFQIRGIPTLVIFRGGIELARQSGAFPEDVFSRWILSTIGGAQSKAAA